MAVGVIALWLMQSAFNSAPLHASLPGVTAAEPVAGMVLGVVAFREKVPASPLIVALQVAGLLALVGGVILVARSPVLASLRQYHGPGEHLLRRDHEQRRARQPPRRPGPRRPGPAAPAQPARTARPEPHCAQARPQAQPHPQARPRQPPTAAPGPRQPRPARRSLAGPDPAHAAWAAASSGPRQPHAWPRQPGPG